MLYAGLNYKKSKSAFQQELKLVVDQLLEQTPITESLFRDLVYPILEGIPQDPFMWIQTLRALALLALTATGNAALAQFKTPITEFVLRVKILRSCPKIQLVDAYEDFIYTCFDSAGSTPQLHHPIVKSNGVAPFEPDGFLSWAQTPMGRYHSELGVLWLLLGQKTNCYALVNAAIQIGNWELNASKFDYSPFSGLYCAEEDFDLYELNAWRQLLFSSLYHHTQDQKFLPAAKHAEQLVEQIPFSDAFLYYLSCTIPKCTQNTPENQHAPSHLQDNTMNLCSWRDPELSLFFTTLGGGSGLGGFTYKSIEVVTYAPHQYPLNEAQGFGINTMPRNSMKAQATELDAARNVSNKGIARLSNLEGDGEAPPWNRYREGTPQTAWVEVSQTLKGNRIEIDTLIRHFDKISDLAFTFFVKADAVRMDDVEAIPNQLRHFVMEVSSLEIVGENCSVRLFQHVDNIPLEQISVEVIPLGGNRAFWGADFLISFLYKKPDLRNRWTLELSD